MRSALATKSTSVGGRARGMEGCAAVSGFWMTTVPPRDLTSPAPTTPSLPMPDSTTAIRRSPNVSAAVASSRSIDGEGRPPRALARLDRVIGDHHVVIGRHEVDVPGHELLGRADRHQRQRGPRGEDLREVAHAGRLRVLRDDDRRREPGGDRAEELAERVDATGRGAHDDQRRELVRLVVGHLGASSVAHMQPRSLPTASLAGALATHSSRVSEHSGPAAAGRHRRVGGRHPAAARDPRRAPGRAAGDGLRRDPHARRFAVRPRPCPRPRGEPGRRRSPMTVCRSRPAGSPSRRRATTCSCTTGASCSRRAPGRTAPDPRSTPCSDRPPGPSARTSSPSSCQGRSTTAAPARRPSARLGGTTIVQDPSEAEFPDMPRHAIETGSVVAALSVAGYPGGDRQRGRGDPGPATRRDGADGAHRRDLAVEPGDRPVGDPRGDPVDRGAHGPAPDLDLPASPYACPSCGGVLYERTPPDQYLCRVGHRFAPEALRAGQEAVIEEALWTALRTLEESASLAARLRDRAAARGQRTLERAFEARHTRRASGRPDPGPDRGQDRACGPPRALTTARTATLE